MITYSYLFDQVIYVDNAMNGVDERWRLRYGRYTWMTQLQGTRPYITFGLVYGHQTLHLVMRSFLKHLNEIIGYDYYLIHMIDFKVQVHAKTLVSSFLFW